MAERNISFTAHQTKTSQPEGFLLRHQWTILPIALAILDGLTVFGVLNLAFNIRFKLNLPIFRTEVMDSPAYYLNLECAMVIAVLVMFLLAGLYNISNLLAGMREYSLVFNCVVILVVLILVVSFLIPAFVISRGWLVMAWLFTFLGVDIERFIFRRFIHQIRKKGYFVKRTIIIGANEESRYLAGQIQDTPRSGMMIIGFMEEGIPAGNKIYERYVSLGNLSQLDNIIEKYHIDPDKIITVHNAVEPADNMESPTVERNLDDKIVTFLGRITFQKGPEYFVEAARKVLDRYPNVRFVMAGTGDMQQKMIRRVAKLKMGTKFHFTGFLKGNEVNKLLAMTDVFVMPSVSEPFGIVPLEAMQSNVPVVISKQSGVSEVLKHAIKVDFWDVNALADAIYGLLAYPKLPEMATREGKSEVDNLKWENAAFLVKQVYERAIRLSSSN